MGLEQERLARPERLERAVPGGPPEVRLGQRGARREEAIPVSVGDSDVRLHPPIVHPDDLFPPADVSVSPQRRYAAGPRIPPGLRDDQSTLAEDFQRLTVIDRSDPVPGCGTLFSLAGHADRGRHTYPGPSEGASITVAPSVCRNGRVRDVPADVVVAAAELQPALR